ncbi:hypothetical protein [Streptomyces sp. NBC_00500]
MEEDPSSTTRSWSAYSRSTGQDTAGTEPSAWACAADTRRHSRAHPAGL